MIITCHSFLTNVGPDLPWVICCGRLCLRYGIKPRTLHALEQYLYHWFNILSVNENGSNLFIWLTSVPVLSIYPITGRIKSGSFPEIHLHLSLVRWYQWASWISSTNPSFLVWSFENGWSCVQCLQNLIHHTILWYHSVNHEPDPEK